MAFAKTSRSPQSFRKIAAELTAEKSAEFHEKWVVGYGHASVAEHAVLHVAIENVSRLAVETHRIEPAGLLHRKIDALPEMVARRLLHPARDWNSSPALQRAVRGDLLGAVRDLPGRRSLL